MHLHPFVTLCSKVFEMFSPISLIAKVLPFEFSSLKPSPLVPALSYFPFPFPETQGTHTSESSRVQTIPTADYTHFMTQEKDTQAKVLVLILKAHRIRSVAVSGVGCLWVSCATADHQRDSKALSALKSPIDFIAEGRRRIWT